MFPIIVCQDPLDPRSDLTVNWMLEPKLVWYVIKNKSNFFGVLSIFPFVLEHNMIEPVIRNLLLFGSEGYV